jgi:hypothetical protein
MNNKVIHTQPQPRLKDCNKEAPSEFAGYPFMNEARTGLQEKNGCVHFAVCQSLVGTDQ